MGTSIQNLFRFPAQVVLWCALQVTGSDIAVAQGIPPHIEAYAKKSQAERPLGMALAERRVAESRKALQITKREPFDSPHAKRDAIQGCQQLLATREAEVARLTDPLQPYYAYIDEKELKIGDIVRLDSSEAFLFQVIDDENMLVEFEWQVRAFQSRDSTSAPTIENVYETTESRTTLVWVRGVDTSRLVSGKGIAYQGVNLQGVFHVSRAENYQTRIGSKSVLLVELIDMKPWTHLFDQRGHARTWKDDSGKHSIEAAFADYKGGNVRIVDMDGKSRTLKLNELSNDDQAYVREQMGLRRKALSEAGKDQ